LRVAPSARRNVSTLQRETERESQETAANSTGDARSMTLRRPAVMRFRIVPQLLLVLLFRIVLLFDKALMVQRSPMHGV